MNERERIDQFNRDLERVIRGAIPPDQRDESQDFQAELDVARRLMDANFSRESSQQAGLEQRLVDQISKSTRKAKWQAIGARMNGVAGSLAWVAGLVVLVAVLSWALRAFQPLPASEQTALPALNLTASPSLPIAQISPPATQPPAWSAHPTATETTGRAASLPATNVKPGPTQPPSQAEIQPTPSPVPTGVSPLTRFSTSEEIRKRLVESWHLWKSVWVDAEVTTIQRGHSAVEREQVWYQQPSQGVWLAGPVSGDPDIIRARVAGRTLETDAETRTSRDLGDIRLVPSMLDKVLFPSWSFAVREGEFKAVGESILSGRLVVVVEFTNMEGVKSDRFWIDSTTGIILRWVRIPVHYAGADEQSQLLEIEITSIAVDVDFPVGIIDPAARLPQQFSAGYWILGTQK